MNENDVIMRSFEKIGARAKITLSDIPDRSNRNVVVDVKIDKKGEYFDIRTLKNIELLILDAAPGDKHLLLMARDPSNPKSKFLCGHDERHWFTAAIPENASVSTVLDAKNALKPKELVKIESSCGVKAKDLHKRRRRLKNGGKIYRQGEFMFVPVPDFKPAVIVILKNEILSRGGNPHVAEYLYRHGGTTVYVCGRFPNGVKASQYYKILKSNPEAKNWNWRTQVRNPDVYVKGKIRHPEHATIDLGDTWHIVFLNTESEAKASKNVASID